MINGNYTLKILLNIQDIGTKLGLQFLHKLT